MDNKLFRGFSVKDNAWHFGSLFHNHITDTSHILKPTINTNVFDVVDVANDSVGQFVGQVDKDGQMIFEGDILMSVKPEKFDIRYRIIFNQNEACFRALVFINDKLTASIKIDKVFCSHVFVVGNVFCLTEKATCIGRNILKSIN